MLARLTPRALHRWVAYFKIKQDDAREAELDADPSQWVPIEDDDD